MNEQAYSISLFVLDCFVHKLSLQVCNDAVFEASAQDLPLGMRSILGDATDSALLRFAEAQVPGKITGFEEVFKVRRVLTHVWFCHLSDRRFLIVSYPVIPFPTGRVLVQNQVHV